MEPRRSLHLASLDAVRERRRLKKARRGDSPEKQSERHDPKPDIVDKMWAGDKAGLKLGGVDFKSRYPER